MNFLIKKICVLQLLAFWNFMHALPTDSVDVNVIKGNSTNGSSSYFVRRKLNSTSSVNLKPLDGLEDISKLLKVVKIKEPINEDNGENNKSTDRYKVYIKRKLKTFKHPRNSKEDRERNATRTYVKSYKSQVNYLPASKSRFHYKQISIGKPMILYSKSKTVSSSPYAVKNAKPYKTHKSEAHLKQSGENGETSRIELEGAKWSLNEDKSQETHLLNKNEGKSSRKTKVINVQIPTELHGIEKEVNINENITEDFQELEEEAKEDLPNIETHGSTQDQESLLGQDNFLHDQLLLDENYETLARDSSNSDDYIQSATGDRDHIPKTPILVNQSNDNQTSFDSYLKGRFHDTEGNQLNSETQEKEFAELNLSSNEVNLHQKEYHINNNTYNDNIFDGTRLPVDDIIQEEIDLFSDPIVPKPTNNVEPGLVNEEQMFGSNDKFEQGQTDNPVNINEELKPALRESIDKKPYDHIYHEELQEQQDADLDPTGKIKMDLINLPSNQSAPENKDNAEVGYKQTIAFLNQNGSQVFSTNIHQGQSQTISGFINNGEIKCTGLSSAQVLNHPEVLKTHTNKASSCKIAQEGLSNNFVSQGVTEESSVDINQERPKVSFNPSNDIETKCKNLSLNKIFKENTYANSGNIKPEQTQIITRHIKEVDCSSCGNIPQEQLSHDLTNQEVVEVSSDFNQGQSHINSDLINNENTEWSDTYSTIVKDNTQFPSSHIYNEQAQIFPMKTNQETNILPETYNTENMQIYKFKGYESNTREELISNEHLFALTNLRELLIQLEIRLKIENNIQLSSFYTMIKFIYLVFKSQTVQDNSEYSIWFWQLHPVVRGHLVKYASILIRRRWLQQLMLQLHNNGYNLDIVKQSGLASYLMSWHNELSYDLIKNLDKPIAERNIRNNNLERFIFTRPYVQAHRVYHFRRPGPQTFTTILGM